MSSGVGATAGAPARGSGGRGRGGRGRGGRGGRASGSSRGPTVATSAGRAVGGPPNGGEGAEGRGNNNRRARNNNNKQSNKRTESESKPAPPTEEQLKQQEDDRRREAEEAARRKEEKARTKAAAAVEEANKKQQQAIQEECQAAIDTLQTTVENLKQRTEARRVFQDESLADLRKKFSANKKSLKTDLKKCTAFVKKIKSGTAWSMKAADIVKDVASLNLSRYVEEVVTAIVEAKPKVNDVAVVVPLCQAMHERYPEFLSPLKTQLWQQQIQSVPTDVEGAKARRVFLRIWTELVARGVITETRSLAKLIGNAAGAPSGEENKYNVADPPLLVAFCKQAGVEFLGEVSASIRQAIEYVRRDNCGGEGDPSDQPLEKGKELVEQLQSLLSNRAVSAETSEVLQVHCRGAYEALVESLIHTHRKLQRLEKRCEQDRLLSGTLPEAREKGLQDARKLKDNLHKSVEALADALDEPAPSLESDTKDDDDGGAGPGIEVLTKTDGEADTGPFDDEETRAFYCDIPDFLTTMPAALLNLSPEAVSTKQEANALKYGESSEDTATSDDDTLELAPLTEEELEADEQEAENSAKEDEGM
jgi:regulator of nonsense transcripts 2